MQTPTDEPGLPMIGMSVAELMDLDTDNPALKRAIASLEDPDGVISAFQSFAQPVA